MGSERVSIITSSITQTRCRVRKGEDAKPKIFRTDSKNSNKTSQMTSHTQTDYTRLVKSEQKMTNLWLGVALVEVIMIQRDSD